MTKTFGNSVDAKAPAKGARPSIFPPRPAPGPVNYLDYPGTMGVDDIDYLVADRVVLEPEQRPYTEKLVHPSDMVERYRSGEPQAEYAVHAAQGHSA